MIAAGRHGLDLVLHQDYQLELLETTPLERPLRIWLKVDTGMHRLGFRPEQAPNLARRLAACANCDLAPRWMTHLADADDLAADLVENIAETFAQGFEHDANDRRLRRA